MKESDTYIRSKRYALLRQFHQKLVSDLEQVRRSRGAEAVHDARVGARRLRVVLKALRKDCHPIMVDTLLFDLRDIGRALAPVRDADVRRQCLAPLLRRIHDANAREASRLLTRLSAARADARRTLKQHMQASTWSTRLQRLATYFIDDGLLALPRPNMGFVLEREALDRRLRSIRKKLKNKSDRKQDLHALRIKVKQARYLCEFVSELDEAAPKTTLACLKKLQTTLGKVHDELQLESWLAAAVDISPTLKHLLRDSLRASIARRRRQLTNAKPAHERFPRRDEQTHPRVP